MGLLVSKLFTKLFGNKEVRILLLGLDNAGKTTILYKLYSPDRVIRTMPTIGFNVEQVVYKNLNFSVWDLGGQTNIRPYWRCYFNNTNAVIYVVDSADRERMSLARKELFAIFQEEEMNGVHLLVFANKQDQRGAMSEVEVARELGLHSIRDRKWHICKAAATKGEGLTEGLDWLADTISGTDTSSSATSTSAATTASASASLPPAASSSAAGDRARDEEGKALS